MSTEANCGLQKKFYACLSLEPTFFEEHLFNFMIRNCNDPTSMLETFKKLFPFFLGENIEKSLKIFRETKGLKAQEVI